ncbi:MAG: DUF3179 domain-containing protein [Planctomycetes bacterium]|nr:DUF3179 domain-containing protein [Planctomycetota bacterium]
MSVSKSLKSYWFSVSFALVVISIPADTGRAESHRERGLPGWKTNTAKRTIELHELEKGGPGKDGIPPIDKPVFIDQKSAQKWLGSNEPVISLVINGQSRAYPLQILIWHEIINDTVGEVPVSVTFCPLCYSANVFDRRVNGRLYSFGVSGMLRHSDMVMYDRQTESLWQQISGEAIVGDMIGSELKRMPAQIISFEQFRSVYKQGLVLSRKTGHRRNYGQNPYTGYDNISKSPFMYRGKKDRRLLPMEKVVTISMAGSDKAYPYSVTRKLQVINDNIAGVPLVIFHSDGAVSALDKTRIDSSRQVGSTGVFDRRVDGQTLSFSHSNGGFYDKQTHSLWDITGQAVKGQLQGKKLKQVVHGDYFAFAWFAFKPETEIYK